MLAEIFINDASVCQTFNCSSLIFECEIASHMHSYHLFVGPVYVFRTIRHTQYTLYKTMAKVCVVISAVGIWLLLYSDGPNKYHHHPYDMNVVFTYEYICIHSYLTASRTLIKATILWMEQVSYYKDETNQKTMYDRNEARKRNLKKCMKLFD